MINFKYVITVKSFSYCMSTFSQYCLVICRLSFFNPSRPKSDQHQISPYNCCGATAGSEQQHNQDLKEIYIGATNSRIHHFLPQCIAFNHSFYHNALHLTRVHCATTTFNQSSLRHCARKARGCHSVVPSSFFE